MYVKFTAQTLDGWLNYSNLCLKRNNSKFYNGYYSEMRHRWDIVNYVSRWWMWPLGWSCQTQQITFNFSGKGIFSGMSPKKKLNLIELNMTFWSRKTEIEFSCKHTPKSWFTTFLRCILTVIFLPCFLLFAYHQNTQCSMHEYIIVLHHFVSNNGSKCVSKMDWKCWFRLFTHWIVWSGFSVCKITTGVLDELDLDLKSTEIKPAWDEKCLYWDQHLHMQLINYFL